MRGRCLRKQNQHRKKPLAGGAGVGAVPPGTRAMRGKRGADGEMWGHKGDSGGLGGGMRVRGPEGPRGPPCCVTLSGCYRSAEGRREGICGDRQPQSREEPDSIDRTLPDSDYSNKQTYGGEACLAPPCRVGEGSYKPGKTPEPPCGTGLPSECVCTCASVHTHTYTRT